ncbi:hypothetical protein M9H77_23754 [Catharanthus roseus]|uniref:Uncharacterized protein n=1 Tax=Catharanthus roseus TaxID=4058 RepID=A0ACC0AUY5_CATRO|nr:hypothetical protein M9H77_23754 [Catharanthus roseus]
MDCHRIIHGDDFPNLLHHALAYLFGHTLVQKGSGLSELRIIDIYMLGKLHNRAPFSLPSLIIQTMRNIGWTPLKACFLLSCDFIKILSFYNVIKFTTFNNCDYSWNTENQLWIPLSEEDRFRDRNPASFCSIKKITQTGLGKSSSQPVEDDEEANESYNLSNDEDDEAGAQTTIPIDAFQTEMWISFEQLQITQEIYGPSW